MILQSLTKYYETLLELEEIPPLYYVEAGVSYGLQLGVDGALEGIVTLKVRPRQGTKSILIPQIMCVPEQFVKAGIAPPSNFLCDNATFLLGFDSKGKPERAASYFKTAKEFHLSILSEADSEAASVIRAYFSNWNPDSVFGNPYVKEYEKELSGGGQIVFILPDGSYAQDDPSLQLAWVNYKRKTQSTVRMQCLVTGEQDVPIKLTHPKIWKLDPGQLFGGSLVGYNDPAYESYGHEMRSKTGQGLNAPVSEFAAFAYTSALNHLLADFDHRMPLDGDTVVCWAESGETQYQEVYLQLVNPRATTEKEVSETFRSIVDGRAVDLADFNPSTPFHVLCLSPNAARVSVRFFLSDTFGRIADHLAAHYRRLEIAMGPGERPYLSTYWMLKETVPTGSNDDAASPLLAGAVLRAILSGAPYPAMLYESVLIRIRADRKINRARAATIKAYLIQNVLPNHPEYEEVLQVALNDQSNLKPYVLGRLFALLEQAQENASPGINATITDRYFDSACATPRLAFPTLLKLNRHHLAKDEKWGWRNEKLIGDLLGKLEAEDDPYPARLTLDEQGLFILGYYHQKQARFTKKEDQNSEKENG